MKNLHFLLILVLLTSCSLNTTNNNENKPLSNNTDSLKIISKVEEKNYDLKQENNDESNYEYLVMSRLPDWFNESKILQNLKLNNDYEFDNRLNPLYLEEDFNGDGNIDIAIPIKQIKTGKVGFAIIHGKTNEIFIVGAGTQIENDISDDMSYIDIWKINREKINGAGAEENTGTGPEGELILENPSIEIKKSEVGGGLIYWKGNGYAYFHQTC